MFKKIAVAVLAVVVILVAAVLAVAATRPDTFRVERTASIAAPPEKIFPLITDFHSYRSWSPWEKLDSTMTRTHKGAANGEGACQSRYEAGLRRAI